MKQRERIFTVYETWLGFIVKIGQSNLQAVNEQLAYEYYLAERLIND